MSCVVLVPVGGAIDPACALGLAELETRGYPVRRQTGLPVDQARNQLASDALADGYDELMWIDTDVGFDADSVEMLREHREPVVCGIYVKKGPRSLACHVLPATERIRFGTDGGLIEIRYAAAGFLLTHRDAYEKIADHEELPLCNQRFGRPLRPWFQPMVIPDGDGSWYLGEDFAFCERARRSGLSIMADSRIRLDHYGRYGYSWEEAGADRPRYATYDYAITS